MKKISIKNEITTLSEAEITSLIKDILNLSFLPLSGADIRDFIYEIKSKQEINENTLKVVLKRVGDSDPEIKRDTIPGRKYVFYSKMREKREGVIEFYIIGQLLTFSSAIKPSIEGEGEDFIKEELIQGVGLIDYYDIRKFCGIHQYASGKTEKSGVQRAMKVEWVKELRDLLQAANTTMMTSAIIYLDENEDIEVEQVSSIGDKQLFKVTIPFGGTTFDEDKIGWILDGQQRMWTTELIAISRGVQGKPIIPIIAPISVAIGNFPSNDDIQLKKRMELVRKIFIVSNETKPIPQMWRKSLISHMDIENIKAMSKKLSKYSYYERLARKLNSDNNSPFKNLVDLKKLTRSRSDSKLITLGNLTECVKYMAEKGFIDDGRYSDESGVFKESLVKIKDYFNTIYVVWQDSWDRDYPETLIRTSIVLFMFSLLTTQFSSISLKKKPREKLIIEEYLPTLLMIRDYTEFYKDDPNVQDLGYGKKYAEKLLRTIIEFCMDYMDEIDDDEIALLQNKVLAIK